MISHDIYAETNPAFGAYLLVSFIRGFIEINPAGPELPLAFLALPLAISGDLAPTFDHTNRKTSLSEWLARNPQIEIKLADRLNDSMDFVAGALRLGCFASAVTLSDSARLQIGSHALKKQLASGLSRDLAQSVRFADRLGMWFAAAGSTKTIYDTMGLTL